MRKVISYSLFGSCHSHAEYCYTQGAIENSERKNIHFPDWEIVIYCNHVDEKDQIVLSKYYGVTLIPVRDWAIGYFWRYLAFDNPDFDVVIVRDLDDRLCARDRAAVTEWLESDKEVHIIRDHIWHRMPMMGGLFGARNHALNGMKDKIDMWSKQLDRPLQHYDDEIFLAEIIYPEVFDGAFIHALKPRENETIHPVKNQDDCYLGGSFLRTWKALPRPEHMKKYMQ